MSSEKNMLTISPEELLSVLRKRFPITIPETIETPEQMQEAGNLLGVYTSNYVYLENMRIAANLVKRKLKREGRPKTRMIATRQQVLFELRMTDSIQAYPDPNGKR